MWTLADKIARTVSDFTIGTVIVLAHVTLANREASRWRVARPGSVPDGSRVLRRPIGP